MKSKKYWIKKIEEGEKYCKVRINRDGEITGMLADEDYTYDTATNTGGRRFIGYYGDRNIELDYDI